MKSYAGTGSIREHLQAGAETNRALYSPEAEQAIIGAAVAAPALFLDAVETIRPEHFGNPACARAWGMLVQMIRDGATVSASLVSDRIGADDDFTAWGGMDRLLVLSETSSTAGIADHLEAILDRSGRRSLHALLQRVGAMIMDTAGGDVPTLIGEIERGCGSIANGVTTGDQWLDMGDMIEAAIARAITRRGGIDFPFGLTKLDQLTGGMAAGETTVLGGWTGMGKTFAGQAIACANARAGLGVCYFSLEMAEYPMAMRAAVDRAYDRRAFVYSGQTSNITIQRAMRGDLEPHEIDRMREAREHFRRLPLKVVVRPGLTIAAMEAAARRMHRRWEKQGVRPGPILVDHLGKAAPMTNRRGDLTAETSDKSNELMAMAKRLQVPVIPMVQLNRGVDQQGEDKRPQLAHLKQSSAIAEDARQVVFLYRPEYYFREPMEHEDFEKKAERLEKLRKVAHQLYWVLDKNSHGPKGQVQTYCDLDCAAIRDWEMIG